MQIWHWPLIAIGSLMSAMREPTKGFFELSRSVLFFSVNLYNRQRYEKLILSG